MASIRIGQVLLRVAYPHWGYQDAIISRSISGPAAFLGHPLTASSSEGLRPPLNVHPHRTAGSVCDTPGGTGRQNFRGYEPWSEDMACVLQGSCMPGSTRYCRTSSMFGKVNIADIAQSSLSLQQRASFHTLRPYVPGCPDSDTPYTHPSRGFSLSGSTGASSGGKSGSSLQMWSEDIACILQGTCLPGSTKYCRTSNMFGALTMSDVVQGASIRYYSTKTDGSTGTGGSPGTGGSKGSDGDGQVSLTQRQRLKLAIRDYGSTVVIFHVCISLMSLGGFYVAVSSGLDVQSLLRTLHFSQEIITSKFAAGASTFVMAYAVHKLFAPARIAVTLTCTPFIVRYLRSVGLLKVKKVVKSPP